MFSVRPIGRGKCIVSEALTAKPETRASSVGRNLMLSFIILGFIVALGIWTYERTIWNWLIRLALLFCISILFVLTAYMFRPVRFLNDMPWYDTSHYREIIFFLVMLTGMVSSTLSRAIKDRRQEIARLKKSGSQFETPGLVIDRWDLLHPFLFSLVTFGGLLSQIEDQLFSLASVTLSFQTGFFWQTVLKGK